MAIPDYKKYLAENVLNERRTVTYRSLGRAFKVHSTLAKQMLYDFHHQENAKKTNSVNATYIIAGTPKTTETPGTSNIGANGSDSNEDEIMPSSPYLPSSMPNQESELNQIPITAIVLAREEDIEDAKSTFESISTIHIYSLQPTILQDLNVLTNVSREMLANHSQEDPLEYGKQWGMIQNKHVKRRTGAPPPIPTPSAAPKTTIPAKRPAQSESSPKKEEPPQLSKPPQRQGSFSSTKPTERTAPVKKEKGSLFSSFAKAKPKQKKEESTPATSGAESAEPSGVEDVALDDVSDEEPDELFPESRKSATNEPRETRKEREEKLKKMMEDDDDEEDEEMPDVDDIPEEPSNTLDHPPAEKEDLKVEAVVTGGRRRGRRQVMKKKTVRDEEGYLVTREEASWESFSEDEPAPPPPKRKPVVNAPKGKAGTRPGQGNIMSFFSKK